VTRGRREMKLLAYLSQTPVTGAERGSKSGSAGTMDRASARCYPARYHERSLSHIFGRNCQRRPGDRTFARAHVRSRPASCSAPTGFASSRPPGSIVVHRSDRHAAGGFGAPMPVCIGDTKALLLGPLTVEPPFRGRGIGRVLLDSCAEGRQGEGSSPCRAGRRRGLLRPVRL